MADTFHCVVLKPTQRLFAGDVYYASVPSVDGMFGVLKGHEMLNSLNPGAGVCTVQLDEAGNEKKQFFMMDGAAQMQNGILTVMGRFAIAVDDIDREHSEKRVEEMTAMIAELESQDEDVQDITEIENCKMRLKWHNAVLDYLNKAN